MLLRSAIADGVEALSRCPECAFVWGFNRPIDESGNRLPWRSTHFAGVPGYARLLERNIVGSPVGVMFRRTAIEEAGGFRSEAQSLEDYDMYLRLSRVHAIACHGNLVAEYRHHPDNMSKDLESMLRRVLWTLNSQGDRVAEDPVLGTALRRGIRDARRRFDGARRMAELSAQLRAHQWVRATWSAVQLMFRYPGLLLSVMQSRRASKRTVPLRTG